MNVKVKLTREENISYFNATEIEIDLEEYLKGVVPSEIGNAHIEACAAQAVAARNFAVSKMKTRGYITDQSSSDQAFRASRFTGYPNAYAGIEKTAGQLLYYYNDLAQCYYSSSNGGMTTSSKDKWGRDYPYLISQEDPYDKGNGKAHGVGMSQYGARKRAEAGHTYKEILAFYFPGTALKGGESFMTIEQFILNWINERIGNPYIYGATQKDCTVSYRKARMKQYPSYASSISKNCYVLAGKGSSCKNCKWYDKVKDCHKKAYDCAQFIRWAVDAAGLPPVKSGATSQWKSDIWDVKGEFKDVPNNKLCCVFRDNNGTKSHVGWYYNGIAYHAQGHTTGVVKTTNTQYKSWTHYAIMKGIYDASGIPIIMGEEANNEEVIKVLYQARVKSETSKLNLRNSPDKTGSRILQIPPRAIVDVLEETNAEWWKIAYEGTIGYAMNEFLEKVDDEKQEEAPAEEVYYVRIKCANASEAKRLAELLGTATAN